MQSVIANACPSLITLPWIALLLLTSCTPTQQDSSTAFQKVDHKNIFRPLDGRWQGKFTIYQDTLQQRPLPIHPKHMDTSYLEQLPLQPKQVIRVTQQYHSKSPYRQKVRIKDVYFQSNGDTTIKHSSGTNLVTDSGLLCIVHKPNEKVVHQGRRLGKHTLLWYRQIGQPQKVEYFKETVRGDDYFIIGWGYYGGVDTSLSPPTWFYGHYKRIKKASRLPREMTRITLQ